jgi:spermidine/putrescine transport system permease protein
MPYPDAVLRWSIRAYLALFLGYLLFPLFYMMLLAFNTSRIPTHRDFQFTLSWFGAAWDDRRMWDGLELSILIGVVVVALSIVLGLGGALALTRLQIRGKSFLYAVLVSPIPASPRSSSGASRSACAPPGGPRRWRRPASSPPIAC